MVQMFSFTEDERAYLTEMRKITTDARGNEVLVGLTLEETDFYINHTRQRITGEDNQRNGGKYLDLHEKHERARLEILGAEIYLRDENPTLH
jgi:hypothetical protein